MVNKDTDFFSYTNNFKKYNHIGSILIHGSIPVKKPLITIAIPTFKRPQLLKESIDSALGQIGYNDYEIIVVDNDPDHISETETLIFGNNNKNLLYYKNESNIGMFGNWNRCIELANGKWVTILNDDDLLHPDYLNIMATFIKTKKKYQLFSCNSVFFHKTNDLIDIKENEKIFSYQISKIEIWLTNVFLGSGSIIFSKKHAMLLGGFNEMFYPNSDYVLWYKFVNNFKCLKINRTLFRYRIFENESLKIETLAGFVKNDYFLRMQAIKKLFFLKIFAKRLINQIALSTIKNHTSYNPEFNISSVDINLHNDKIIDDILFKIIHKIIGKLVFRFLHFRFNLNTIKNDILISK